MVQDSIRDKIFLIHFKSRITVFENKSKALIFNHMFDTFFSYLLTLESLQFQVHFSHFWSENFNVWKMKIHCVGCVLKIRAYCCQRNGNHLVGGLVLKDVLHRRASSLELARNMGHESCHGWSCGSWKGNENGRSFPPTFCSTLN